MAPHSKSHSLTPSHTSCVQLCNSKAHDQFTAFKKKAMQERRDERLQKADQQVITLKEIAEKIT